VQQSNGQPVAGAAVTTIAGKSATTASDGTFAIPGVPTVQGSISVNATATIAGTKLSGVSASALPVAGGTTAVGDIAISQSKGIFLLGTDAVSLHGDQAFAGQLWALLGSMSLTLTTSG